jgi:hypothetical protein
VDSLLLMEADLRYGRLPKKRRGNRRTGQRSGCHPMTISPPAAALRLSVEGLTHQENMGQFGSPATRSVEVQDRLLAGCAELTGVVLPNP